MSRMCAQSLSSANYWLEYRAEASPNTVAVVDLDDEAWTWRSLASAARSMVDRIGDAGVGRGDRVAILVDDDIATIAALHAVWIAGAVAVPIHRRFTAAESERVLESADCAAMIDTACDAVTSGRGATRDPSSAGGRSTRSEVLVVLTSGTTSAAKGVKITSDQLERAARTYLSRLGVTSGDTWLAPLPLAHIGGIGIVVRSALSGCRIVLCEPSDTDRIARYLASCRERSAVVSLVPTQLDRALRSAAALMRARVLLGGAAASQRLIERACDAGLEVFGTYGLSEVVGAATIESTSCGATAGVAVDGLEVRIVDGEICVAGPQLSAGYEWGGDLAVDDGGMYHTGDAGFMDGTRRLVVTGRLDDLINVGGENVNPAEIEAVIDEHPAVEAVLVDGVPDFDRGQVVRATVAGRIDSKTVKKHCQERLAPFKVPRIVEVVDSLETSSLGKVKRT